MRVLVTGASGFVGGWLTRALTDAGHEVLAPEGLDVTIADDVVDVLTELAPDAVAHLAAVAFAPDAASEPGRAFETTIGGTINVFEAVRQIPRPPAVLVTGSSEVYGAPGPDDLPLRETASVRPRTPYSLSKAAQESVGLAYAAREGLRVCVTRSFNHAGPGQRPVFVVPALAERVRAMAQGEATSIATGNLDVRRDLTDVRDVADAYRRLLEALLDGTVPAGGLLLNVCSGRAVAIRSVLEELCRLAGVEPVVTMDPGLMRPDDAPEIRGDATRIERLLGWRATTPLTTTLADVWAAIQAPGAVADGSGEVGPEREVEVGDHR